MGKGRQSGRKEFLSIKRDTFYNLLGSLIPMLIGMATVPMYCT